MADYNFSGNTGEAIARELLLLYLNTGTKEAPVWSLIGHRVEDSSMELDWQRESIKDIVGTTRNSMKKPIITQSFEPWDLANGDVAQKKIWDLAFVEQNAQALCNMDLLLEHRYAGFAERNEASSIEVTGLGGAGGGNVGMPINVTFGGERTIGTVTNTGGTITFNKAA
jgi:hypothetical protein